MSDNFKPSEFDLWPASIIKFATNKRIKHAHQKVSIWHDSMFESGTDLLFLWWPFVTSMCLLCSFHWSPFDAQEPHTNFSGMMTQSSAPARHLSNPALLKALASLVFLCTASGKSVSYTFLSSSVGHNLVPHHLHFVCGTETCMECHMLWWCCKRAQGVDILSLCPHHHHFLSHARHVQNHENFHHGDFACKLSRTGATMAYQFIRLSILTSQHCCC